MKEKVIRLKEATRALVAYIEENQVFDKTADCGCGGVDTFRSDPFEAVIRDAKEALKELEID